MNFGECPYPDCEEILMVEVPERTPAYNFFDCEKCKRKIWYRFSRLDPMAYTVEDFEKQFEIDPINHTIVDKVK